MFSNFGYFSASCSYKKGSWYLVETPFLPFSFFLGGGKREGWRFAYIGSMIDLNIRKGCWEGRFSFRTFAIFVFILGDGKFNILLL